MYSFIYLKKNLLVSLLSVYLNFLIIQSQLTMPKRIQPLKKYLMHSFRLNLDFPEQIQAILIAWRQWNFM